MDKDSVTGILTMLERLTLKTGVVFLNTNRSPGYIVINLGPVDGYITRNFYDRSQEILHAGFYSDNS